jgi:hypothetical protein
MTAAVVAAGLLLAGLLATNTDDDDAPNTLPLGGTAAWNNDGITLLDVVTAVDPKVKAGPT